MKPRLAIVTTHPIQYYAPVFQLLSKSAQVEIKVFYTWGESSIKKHDPDFDQTIEWDIPLLDGYNYEFLNNISKKPGSHHFYGINNPTLIQSIQSFEPDIILIYGWAYQSHLKVIRHFKNKKPLWFRGDSTLLDKKPVLKNLMSTVLLKWVYNNIDKAFYVGKANKDYFLQNGLKEHQLCFIPHAIDNYRFETNRSEEVFALRDELKLSETDILILFAGKLEAKKDPMLLLEAFIQMQRSHVHLLFAGSGILEKELKLKADKNPNIHFNGFQNQQRLPVYYQACDLFCLPSKGPGETWGLAVNEAMACGKAVLVSDQVGCAEDLVRPGENGYVFMSANLQSLKEKLDLLLKKDTLKRYGCKSKELIQNWNFTSQIDAIENALKSKG